MPDMISQLDDRVVTAQAWFLASELFRRHPNLKLIETHPHWGQHDCLTLVDASGPVPETLIDFARTKFIWVRCAPNQGLAHIHWLDTLMVQSGTGGDDRHHHVKQIEEIGRLAPPVKTPPSTPAALTYRVIARVLASLMNERQTWDARNEFLDTSEQMTDSACRHMTDRFPSAARAIQEQRPDDLLGNSAYRYWGLSKDNDVVAILDTDGLVHLRRATHSLPDLYHANGRSLTRTIAAALGPVLP